MNLILWIISVYSKVGFAYVSNHKQDFGICMSEKVEQIINYNLFIIVNIYFMLIQTLRW